MNPVSGDWAAIFTVHFFGILLAVLTAFGLYLVAREIFERRPELWIIPPLLYGVVTTSKCAIDGLAVNGELLMNLPIVFAVLAVIRGSRRGSRQSGAPGDKTRGVRCLLLDLSAGFLMGLAGLCKWQAMVAGVAFPFLMVTSSSPESAGSNFSDSNFFGRVFRAIWVRGPAWIVGLLLPFVGFYFYFRAHGALDDARRWGLYNLLYISEGPGFLWGLKRFAVQFGAVIVPSIVFYGCALVGGAEFTRGLKKDPAPLGLLVWAFVSAWAVSLGARFFGHYFLQAELPLSLLAAAPLYRLWSQRPKLVGALIGVPVLAFFLFGLMPQLTRDIFDAGTPDYPRIGEELAQRSQAGESLFVWGNSAPIYFFSHRRPGTRFVFCNLLTGLSPGTPSEYDPKASAVTVSESWPLLMSDLEVDRPVWILDTASAGWKGYGKFPISGYPQFEAFLASHYRQNGVVDGAVLYRRND